MPVFILKNFRIQAMLFSIALITVVEFSCAANKNKSNALNKSRTKILITGSSGHLGEALVRVLRDSGYKVVGLDILPSDITTFVGSITDRNLVRRAISDVDVIIHTATLHKPHVAVKSKQDFIDVNISGTLMLLEEASKRNIKKFIFTSTTSAFGTILNPGINEPAVWVDETLKWSIPKNIYGVTKRAAEDLCALFSRKNNINCIVLRTSRFFLEDDDNLHTRTNYTDANSKANEFLFRRVDLEDVAIAHELAIQKLESTKFARYIISATSPFTKEDLQNLHDKPSTVVAKYFPNFAKIYDKADFKMFSKIDRVYVNDLARKELHWKPKYDFEYILTQIQSGSDIGSDLSRSIGKKSYHVKTFSNDEPYPVEQFD